MPGATAPDRRTPRSSSKRPGLLARWTAFICDHPKKVLLGALAAVVLLGALSFSLAGEFSDSFNLPGAESQKAYDLLEERFPQQSGSTATLVFETTAADGIRNSDVQAQIESILADVATLPHVVSVLSPFEAENQISDSGSIAYATISYDELTSDIPLKDAQKLIDVVDASSTEILRVEAGGEVVVLTEQEFGNTAELVGIGAAIIILLVAFGSVVAMGLPIITALLGLIIGFMGISIVTRFMDVATFAPAFAAMIGIGVGIDYALFIVTRYREGLADGLDVRQAVIRAFDTSGRAVIFAGSVVVISMLGLSVIGVPFVTALGLAAAMVVLSAVLVAVVFLPIFLRLVGRRIDKWSVHRTKSVNAEDEPAFGRRLSSRIRKTPGRYAGAAAGLLIVMALPIANIDLGFPDAGSNPTDFHSRRAFDLLNEGFGVGFNSPLILVVEEDGGIAQTSLDALTSGVAGVEGVVQVDDPIVNEAGDTAVITVIPAEDANSGATRDLVTTFRETVIPEALDGSSTIAYVGGPTGSFLDFSDHMTSRTPYVFIVIIGLSIILLTIVFRSPVIALKAALMNVLSISAAFGVVVAVFQWGWGASLFGIQETQPIAVFMPMFLFAILFGLSMDYEVFLLSRIREFWVAGRDTSDAVADGLAITARVITAAAAIMVAVFLSFVFTPDPILKQMGLGLAVAILIDATIVRLILVPATMELLGEWNWWFPSWMDRLVPHINIEGTDASTDLEVAPG
ncbi:MAG: MMPL family transporter, partial [Thermomicrobiales bacterium]